ncbi:hypothetical protein E2C01_036713 [Portunus trituberculatus]|uniref:Uncharacterized protein n=1 Tax=Portunus trituberculatus TaxID=210409 RepID=A0A5B7FC44_PORTR|nr:hypothetical protein [Portunus trituberculatus]
MRRKGKCVARPDNELEIESRFIKAAASHNRLVFCYDTYNFHFLTYPGAQTASRTRLEIVQNINLENTKWQSGRLLFGVICYSGSKSLCIFKLQGTSSGIWQPTSMTPALQILRSVPIGRLGKRSQESTYSEEYFTTVRIHRGPGRGAQRDRRGSLAVYYTDSYFL